MNRTPLTLIARPAAPSLMIVLVAIMLFHGLPLITTPSILVSMPLLHMALERGWNSSSTPSVQQQHLAREGATQGHAIAGHLLDYMRCVTAQHHQQTSHKGASTCADLVYIYGMTCSFFSYSLADLTAQHHPMSLTSTYPEREEGYISPYFSCALSHLYLPTLIYQ